MTKTKEEIRETAGQLTKMLADQGKLVEAGWISLRLLTIPEDAPDTQVNEMRNAFFAGAQHVFGSIMTMMDPEEEPTDKDLERMDLISKELNDFIVDFEERHGMRSKEAGHG